MSPDVRVDHVSHRRKSMSVSGDGWRDWTYRDARRRMLRAGRARLAGHVGIPSLDDYGNRVVQCGCGWRGNGLGWAGHVDSVVCSAVESDTAT